MAQEKMSFEQFVEVVEARDKAFVQDLHNYMHENGCKSTFEEKKTGLLASYKYKQKSVINVLVKKHGLLVRIYGENHGGYADFLQGLTDEMVKSIAGSGDCKRLVSNTCSPKCMGYDFTVRGEHYQKCRYSCFEFLITDESRDLVRGFVERELGSRTAA